MEKKKSSRKASDRVSKQDWLAAALDLLRSGGIEAVRVERLADKLDVSKSGFYYHFQGRAGLLQALLDEWLRLDAEPILEEQRIASASPQKKLAMVAELVDRGDLSRYDAAVRQWARQDPKVRRVWRKEMNKRLSLLRQIFEECGYCEDDLEMRVRLFVAYHTSERDLFSELSSAERARYRDLRLKLLTTP